MIFKDINFHNKMETLDFINLIEKNSITRLSKTYNNKLINRIKETFTTEEQKLFLSSFYCYLNYDKTAFIIDFDNIWKWVGFTRKDSSKKILFKHFTENIDYIINNTNSQIIIEENNTFRNLGGSGLNKETILLTVNAFKKFCLKASTKKADEIHDYYIKLEEILQETINEETNELRLQLQNKEIEFEELTFEKTKLEKKNFELEKDINKLSKTKKKEQAKKGSLIYLGTNELDKEAFKAGICQNDNARTTGLSGGTTTDFIMKDIWYTRFNKEIEDAVKKNYRDVRILQRKELYQIEYYDEIKTYVDKLVKFFNELDRFPEEAIDNTIKKREVKNPDLLDHKVCSMCQIDKPLDNFHFAKEHVDGHENTCKECVIERQEKFIEEKRQTTEIPTEKGCTQCEKILPLDSFYVDNEKFDRRGTKCKKCIKEVQIREKDHEHITEYKCNTCQEIKPIEEFHLLKRSKTGHRYSCKICENKKGTERYHKLKKEEDELIALELELNKDKELTEEEKNNLKEEKLGEIRERKKEELKQKRDEINRSKLENKINCPCGSVTNELGKNRHEKTKKHLAYLERLEIKLES